MPNIQVERMVSGFVCPAAPCAGRLRTLRRVLEYLPQSTRILAVKHFPALPGDAVRVEAFRRPVRRGAAGPDVPRGRV